MVSLAKARKKYGTCELMSELENQPISELANYDRPASGIEYRSARYEIRDTIHDSRTTGLHRPAAFVIMLAIDNRQ